MKNVTSGHQRLFERQKKTYCIIYVVFYLNFVSLNKKKKYIYKLSIRMQA